MPEIVYPTEYEQKVLTQEAPGGPPASVQLVIPSVTAPGEPFDAHVAVLDETGYPSLSCESVLKVKGIHTRPLHCRVSFVPGEPAVAVVRGITIQEPGLHRLLAEMDEDAAFSNPTCCNELLRDHIYWGDPHVHTVLSDCHPDKCRSLTFCYVAARWLTGLNWVTAADHVSNGRSSRGKWREQIAAGEHFNNANEFVTLPGYEASLKGMAGGDNNVYMSRWPDLFVDEFEDGNVRTLCEKLGQKLEEGEYFAVPHHTTRTGKHGEIPDEIYPGPDRMPVLEIHSKWGTSEFRGNPNALHKIHPGPSYATDLLARGLPLGFIGGTDTHATMPSGAGDEPGHIDRLPGLTAVCAPELSREAIFEGIRNRACYATSLERIYIAGNVDETSFGRIIENAREDQPCRVHATVAGRTPITSLEIVRNGETVHAVEPGDWKAELDWTDPARLGGVCMDSDHMGRFAYYYVRVTCQSGAQGWSSPVWLRLA